MAQDRTLGLEYFSDRLTNLMKLRITLCEKRDELISKLKVYDGNVSGGDTYSSEDASSITSELVRFHAELEKIVDRSRFYFSENLYISIQKKNTVRETLNDITAKHRAGLSSAGEGVTNRDLCAGITEYSENTIRICEQELSKVRAKLDTIAGT